LLAIHRYRLRAVVVAAQIGQETMLREKAVVGAPLDAPIDVAEKVEGRWGKWINPAARIFGVDGGAHGIRKHLRTTAVNGKNDAVAVADRSAAQHLPRCKNPGVVGKGTLTGCPWHERRPHRQVIRPDQLDIRRAPSDRR